MRFLRRSGKERDADRFDDPKYLGDLSVLAELKKQGIDIAMPRMLEHFLYFDDEAAARKVADELSGLGYSADVSPPTQVAAWAIVATHTVAPMPLEIRRIRAELTSIAEAVGGEYDGWGTPL